VEEEEVMAVTAGSMIMKKVNIQEEEEVVLAMAATLPGDRILIRGYNASTARGDSLLKQQSGIYQSARTPSADQKHHPAPSRGESRRVEWKRAGRVGAAGSRVRV